MNIYINKIPKKIKKQNSHIKKKTLPINNSNNPSELKINEYIVKKITGYGNCFFRALFYYYRQDEKDFDEYRQLIVSYIENNIDEYLIFIANEDLEDDNINNYTHESLIKKKEYILKYTENAKKDKVWAGYLEISTAGILFNANIRLYIIYNNTYKNIMNLHKMIIIII